MIFGHINWSKGSEQGEVKFTKEYTQAYNILKLDFLKDIIEQLESEYNSLLAKPPTEG